MEHDDLLRIARRRARAKFGFFIHLAVFTIVNVMLYFVNQRTTPDFAWFPYPLGGWAIGVTIHGLAVYMSGSGLRERMVDNELRKLQDRHGPGAR